VPDVWAGSLAHSEGFTVSDFDPAKLLTAALIDQAASIANVFRTRPESLRSTAERAQGERISTISGHAAYESA
jgi:hypothetical protein